MKPDHDLHSDAAEKPDGPAPDKKERDAGMPAVDAKAEPAKPGEEHARMTHSPAPGDAMARGDHAAMMRHGPAAEASGGNHERAMYRDSLWASFVNLLFGIWLIASPPTLGYGDSLASSDYASGALVVVLSALAFARRWNTYARWAICFVGLWVMFAPLVFWTPSAAAYLNDSLVGALVIAFAALVTMMPGMDMSVMMAGPDVPPGWSYNPSTWLQRAPIILLAAVGFFASRYMAAFQLGHISQAWDPVFGEGTRRVLQSDVSKMFPISDAGLGAVSYLLEILMGFMGDRARWRTMPWMVTFFGILVVPLGATSIMLVILQPLSVGAWCFLCLLAALAMLAMVPATLDEVAAMIQFLIQARREGKPLWRTFWHGGVIEGGERDDRLTPFDWSRPQEMFAGWLRGVWHLLIVAGVGGWLMFAPDFFSTTGRASDSDRLVGALALTFALVATAEVGRALRLFNLILGAWLVIAPWVLDGFMAGARWNDVVAGIAVILLSLPRGKIRGRYGSWQPFIV